MCQVLGSWIVKGRKINQIIIYYIVKISDIR